MSEYEGAGVDPALFDLSNLPADGGIHEDAPVRAADVYVAAHMIPSVFTQDERDGMIDYIRHIVARQLVPKEKARERAGQLVTRFVNLFWGFRKKHSQHAAWRRAMRRL